MVGVLLTCLLQVVESLHHFFIIRVDIPDQFEKLTATHVVDVFDVSEAFEGINYRRDS